MAVHHKQARSLVIAALSVFGLMVCFGLARGVDFTDLDPVDLAFLMGGPALITLALWLRRFAAGPGWFSQQHMLGRTEWVRTDRLVRLASRASGAALSFKMTDDEGRSLEVENAALHDAPGVAVQVKDDVRRSLARTGPDGQPLLNIDWRSRTFLLGDPAPPLRERFTRRKRR